MTTNPTDPSPADLEVLREQLDQVNSREAVGIAARCVRSPPRREDRSSSRGDGTLPDDLYLTSSDRKGCSVFTESDIMVSNELLDEDIVAAYARAHRDYIARRNELGEVEEIAGSVSRGACRLA